MPAALQPHRRRHQYRRLSADELRFVLTHHWRTLGLELADNDFTDSEAAAAVARITNGNFRLVDRLLAQIKRVPEVNQPPRSRARSSKPRARASSSANLTRHIAPTERRQKVLKFTTSAFAWLEPWD
jgi:hypothetical protein